MTVTRVTQAEDVIWRRVGDEIVVIKDDGLATHVLNKTAAFIWELCDGTCRVDELVAGLCKRFDVTFEQARIDVKEIIEKLVNISILTEVKEVVGR